MDELIRQHLERLAGQLGALTAEYTRVQLVRVGPSPQWMPAINAWRCGNRFVICADLAGVDPQSISVRAEARRLLIAGNRPPPEPPHEPEATPQTLAMEIDYGLFERILELPEPIDTSGVTAQYRDGLLWVNLPMLRPMSTPHVIRPQ